jgi:hypothetical protein
MAIDTPARPEPKPQEPERRRPSPLASGNLVGGAFGALSGG